jgi:hypothetical protein
MIYTYIINLFGIHIYRGQGFFFQFCEVGELMIIHNKT